MIYLRWPTTVTTKTKISRQKQNTSRQNQKPHGKTKDLTAKPKTSRQNQRPYGKTKYFRAKTKYLTAKANTHGKTKAILLLLWSIWFCREVFGFAVRYFVFCYYFLRRLFAKHQTLSSWCWIFSSWSRSRKIRRLSTSKFFVYCCHSNQIDFTKTYIFIDYE